MTMASAHNVQVADRIWLDRLPPDKHNSPQSRIPHVSYSQFSGHVASHPIRKCHSQLGQTSSGNPQYDLPSSFCQNKAHHLAHTSYHCSHTGRVTSILRSPRLLGDTPNIAKLHETKADRSKLATYTGRRIRKWRFRMVSLRIPVSNRAESNWVEKSSLVR